MKIFCYMILLLSLVSASIKGTGIRVFLAEDVERLLVFRINQFKRLNCESGIYLVQKWLQLFEDWAKQSKIENLGVKYEVYREIDKFLIPLEKQKNIKIGKQERPLMWRVPENCAFAKRLCDVNTPIIKAPIVQIFKKKGVCFAGWIAKGANTIFEAYINSHHNDVRTTLY